MTDKTEAQPEALRLADSIDPITRTKLDNLTLTCAATELRFQHAEIQQLKAQLSARQAAPDGWHAPGLGEVHNADHSKMIYCADGDGVADDALANEVLNALLTAAPPPPEREPLSETEVRGLLESAGYWPGEDAQRADFINGLRYCEMAHGIGSTNDNP